MATLQEEVNVAGAVAKASTKAAVRATLIGVIPIVEFGLIIALTLIVVALPLKIVERWTK